MGCFLASFLTLETCRGCRQVSLPLRGLVTREAEFGERLRVLWRSGHTIASKLPPRALRLLGLDQQFATEMPRRINGVGQCDGISIRAIAQLPVVCPDG
jgi:hypothetical protein